MQSGDKRRERLEFIRAAMGQDSETRGGRRATDREFQFFGNQNIIAKNVVYHFAPSSCPIVTPRSFKGVDWKQAPKLAQWWAVDKDGVAHWFCRPNVAAFTEFWYAESVIAPDFDYDGDWRDSLTERPGTAI